MKGKNAKLSYEAYHAVKGVAGDLRPNEIFALLEANEDYFYMGVLLGSR